MIRHAPWLALAILSGCISHPPVQRPFAEFENAGIGIEKAYPNLTVALVHTQNRDQTPAYQAPRDREFLIRN